MPGRHLVHKEVLVLITVAFLAFAMPATAQLEPEETQTAEPSKPAQQLLREAAETLEEFKDFELPSKLDVWQARDDLQALIDDAPDELVHAIFQAAKAEVERWEAWREEVEAHNEKMLKNRQRKEQRGTQLAPLSYRAASGPPIVLLVQQGESCNSNDPAPEGYKCENGVLVKDCDAEEDEVEAAQAAVDQHCSNFPNNPWACNWAIQRLQAALRALEDCMSGFATSFTRHPESLGVNHVAP